MKKREKLWAAYELARTRDAVTEAKYTAQGYSLFYEANKIGKLAENIGKKIAEFGFPASVTAESLKSEIQALDALNETRAARKSAANA
jgi:hypothetical protein